MSLAVRALAAEDLPALAVDLPDVEVAVHERHLAMQAAGSRVYLGAWLDGGEAPPAVVGTCVVLLDGCREEALRRALPDAGELAALHVVPLARGRGVGTALLRAGEHELETRGVPRSVVCVDRNNARAAALYRRLGYEPTGTRAEVRYQLGSGRSATEVVEQVEALVRELEPA
jgi:ribosomal protein S18 acetylase RimI-like enzyme